MRYSEKEILFRHQCTNTYRIC